tara:strand:+ start:47 stop:424 length:378 start_codon:yes stop_codon:yes gene_type:complete
VVIKNKSLVVLALCLMLGACSNTGNLYYWGNYEDMIYKMYLKPGEATPLVQIERLTRDIQKAASVGKPVPPGLFAHIGFMHVLQGNKAAAYSAFEEEKTRFPESAAFLDGVIERAEKAQAQGGAS